MNYIHTTALALITTLTISAAQPNPTTMIHLTVIIQAMRDAQRAAEQRLAIVLQDQNTSAVVPSQPIHHQQSSITPKTQKFQKNRKHNIHQPRRGF